MKDKRMAVRNSTLHQVLPQGRFRQCFEKRYRLLLWLAPVVSATRSTHQEVLT
jgi:hypothetical protein